MSLSRLWAMVRRRPLLRSLATVSAKISRSTNHLGRYGTAAIIRRQNEKVDIKGM
jgi:hypothetical protein